MTVSCRVTSSLLPALPFEYFKPQGTLHSQVKIASPKCKTATIEYFWVVLGLELKASALPLEPHLSPLCINYFSYRVSWIFFPHGWPLTVIFLPPSLAQLGSQALATKTCLLVELGS
jgi:hypothetical protein